MKAPNSLFSTWFGGRPERSCAVGSAVGASALGVALVFAGCRSAPPHADVPPVTRADPSAMPLGDVTSTSLRDTRREATPPVTASFADLPAKIEGAVCERTLVAIAKGKATVLGETLGAGDVLVLHHQITPVEATGAGLVLVVHAHKPCAVRDAPAATKNVVRASAAPKLEFAGGKMAVHLDVGTALSPDVYLGRIEGTAPVAEHTHPGTWEILAAVEAAGTFTLDGKEQRLGPKQIVFVPPDAKHAWKPDANAKLVGIQMYSPPGPEQRFLTLAAATPAAGDGGAPDGGSKATPPNDAGTKP